MFIIWFFKSYHEPISFLCTQPFSVLALDLCALFIWKQKHKQNHVYICLLSSNISFCNWLRFCNILSEMLFLRQACIVRFFVFFFWYTFSLRSQFIIVDHDVIVVGGCWSLLNVGNKSQTSEWSTEAGWSVWDDKGGVKSACSQEKEAVILHCQPQISNWQLLVNSAGSEGFTEAWWHNIKEAAFALARRWAHLSKQLFVACPNGSSTLVLHILNWNGSFSLKCCSPLSLQNIDSCTA